MMHYKRPIKSVTVEFKDGEICKFEEFDTGFIRMDDGRVQKKSVIVEEFWQWEIRLTRKKFDPGAPSK